MHYKWTMNIYILLYTYSVHAHTQFLALVQLLGLIKIFFRLLHTLPHPYKYIEIHNICKNKIISDELKINKEFSEKLMSS